MDDEWLRVEELLHLQEKVAEYEASPAARLEHAGAVAAPLPHADAVPALLLAPTCTRGGAQGGGGTCGCAGAVLLAPRGLGGGTAAGPS